MQCDLLVGWVILPAQKASSEQRRHAAPDRSW